MPEGKSKLYRLAALFVAVFYSLCADAQVDSLLRLGDAYHKAYRFDDAIDSFDRILDIVEDTSYVTDSSFLSSIYERINLSENGKNMSRYAHTPKVAGRRMLSLDEFHLYFPVENEGWRKLPNVLDNDESNPFVRALYAPDWNDVHYYSALDENGVRSIFRTELQDTLWTVPVKVEELSTSTSNEICPMLAPDGKTIYFASDGLFGVGGYDIYRSEWNELNGQWDPPHNMGFPFSSPEDDFLYVDSEDERYTVFASTRDCPKDSVWVFAIEYERSSIQSPVTGPEKLMELSRLMPAVKEKDNPGPLTVPDELEAKYMSQMDRVRILKDSIDTITEELNELRHAFDFSNDDEADRFKISSDIIELEKKIPSLQVKLGEAKIDLRKTEDEFIKRGIFDSPDHDDISSDDDALSYEFARLEYGDSLVLNIAQPEEKFDYSFRVLEESLFAEDQSIPPGIIYQIQLLGGSYRLDAPSFKGLTPVYEHVSPSGMFIYRVGRFSSYNEALDCIYKVRDLGFRSAYLCAFENGKEISVAKARTMQEQLKSGFSLYEILIIPDSGELDPHLVDVVTARAIGKDIKRSEAEDGTLVFSVGPFDDGEAAEELTEVIRNMVTGSVECKSISNDY